MSGGPNPSTHRPHQSAWVWCTSSWTQTGARSSLGASLDGEEVRNQPDVIATVLVRQFRKAEPVLRDVAEDITVFADFPTAHQRYIWFTEPLDRINKEIQPRTNVVGVLPNLAALMRLVDSVLNERDNE